MISTHAKLIISLLIFVLAGFVVHTFTFVKLNAVESSTSGIWDNLLSISYKITKENMKINHELQQLHTELNKCNANMTQPMTNVTQPLHMKYIYNDTMYSLSHDHARKQFVFVYKDKPMLYFQLLLRISGYSLQTVFFQFHNETNSYVATYKELGYCDHRDVGVIHYADILVYTMATKYDDANTCRLTSEHVVEKSLQSYNWTTQTTLCDTEPNDSWWHLERRVPFFAPGILDTPPSYVEPPNIGSITTLLISRILQKKQICFIGDSQMRNNVNALYNCNTRVNQQTHALCATSAWYRNPLTWQTGWLGADTTQYATRWRDIDTLDVSDCARIVVNFGQWDVGFPGGRMTTISEYKHNLEDFVQNYRYIDRVIWMTTNPFGDDHRGRAAHGFGECPPQEHRFPHIIQDLNTVAADIMQKARVPTWDTFRVLFQVFDFSFDGAHYDEYISRCIKRDLLDILLNETM